MAEEIKRSAETVTANRLRTLRMSYENSHMGEAIALSSPSGRMSKRARNAANARLRTALFGPDGIPDPTCEQETERERLIRNAEQLESLANRGMSPRKFRKEAAKLRTDAARQLR